jgi:uncharacterized protein YggE
MMMRNEFNQRAVPLAMRPLLCALIAGSLFAADEPARVIAHGEASASGKPDQVRIQIGVVTQAPTAAEAGAQNAKQSSAVIADLKQLLGSSGEYQTSNYSMYPMYGNPKPGSKPVISAYQANNTVEVRINDVSAAGKVIDVVTKAGANQVQGIHFSMRDEQKVRGEALAKAAVQARANAQALASAVGLRVLRLVRIEDGEPVRVVPMRAEMMMMKSADAPQTPVEPGDIQVHATVTVTAEVGP